MTDLAANTLRRLSGDKVAMMLRGLTGEEPGRAKAANIRRIFAYLDENGMTVSDAVRALGEELDKDALA